MFILGAGIGSFACCQAWRFYLKINKKPNPGSRSVCLNCNRKLRWFENIPILSWLFLKGKCRYCHKKIGLAEFLSEILTALAFLAISTTINIESATTIEWIIFTLNLLLTTTLSFLAIYDGKWGELPTFALIIAIIISIIIASINQIALNNWSLLNLADLLGAIAILFGTYFILNKISKGKWVGDGDAYIGLAIALALSSSWLAIWVLFIANFLGTIVAIFIMQKSKHQKLYFGPFLSIGFIIALSLSSVFYAILK